MMNRLMLFLFILMASGFGAKATDIPRFISETESAGIKSIFEGTYIYMAGAGVAVFDCSGDGLADLYFAGGENPASLYINHSEKAGTLQFTKQARPNLELTHVLGTYPLDIDGDRITDLVVLRIGENMVFKGKGQCEFERANERWSFDGGAAWSTAFSAIWEKAQPFPSLAIGNFMKMDTIVMGYGDCDESKLYRPAHTGKTAFAPAIDIEPGHCTLSMLFSDWNRDGVPDLRISNDKEFYRNGQEQLFTLPPDQELQVYGPKEGWQKVEIWGMGIASHDLNKDGYPDYYLTNITENRLEILTTHDGTPSFKDQARRLGIEAGYPFTGGDKKPSTAWHAEFEDANNDGLHDLLVVKGNVETVTFGAYADPNNLLLQTLEGTFIESAEKAGVLSYKAGRAGGLVDLNGDGALDLIVTNRSDPVEIWRNEKPLGNWISVQPDQDHPNWSAVGGWIEVKVADKIQRKEITIGGGHGGGKWGPHHFGVGAAHKVQIRVIWPDQTRGDWKTVGVNKHVKYTR